MKSFNKFFTEYKVKRICKKYEISNYTINSDGSIDVDGDVDLSNCDLDKLPLIFKVVTGSYNCSENGLTTLEGCPESVGGHFDCSENNLTSLNGAPESVGGHFDCSENNLTSLNGAPKNVGNYFNCNHNQLTTLKGCPGSITGSFDCSDNQLDTLEGGPKSVGGIFFCNNNQLTTLEYAPEFIVNFTCLYNPIFEIYDLFDTPECIEWINEYDVIQGDKVILDRLEEVFYQLGMTPPENIKLENYEII